MIRKYALFSSASCLLLSALAIISGCGQPAAAPARTEGLAPVPPQPSATPQPASVEPVPSEPAALAIPAPKAPKTPAEPAVAIPKNPKEVPAATIVPLGEGSVSAKSDAPNLVPEGNWEEGYPGWQLRGKAEIKVDEKEKLFGVRSLRVGLKGSTGCELVRWEVAKGEVKAGNRYLLRGYIKTQDIDSEASVYLTAFTINSTSKQMSWFKSSPITKNTAWAEVDVPVQVPEGADALAVRIEYEQNSKKAAKGGTVWVDDVSVTQVTQEMLEPENLLTNGDFEAFTNNWTDLPDASHLASDTDVKQLKGSASLRIDLKGLDKAFVLQWIKGITPNTTYRLDGFVKTKEAAGDAFLTVMAENSKRSNKAWLSTKKVNGTADWRKLSLQVKTADDTDTLAIRFEFRSEKEGVPATSGSVWLDNFTLTKIE
ncbi:MAG: carbohydrate binding domain-containing protein [Candidatus Hydrogenedentes bacterium]|nr:carbohydrate binding domain-containing protein [Candidatus Hydrogenedentota bacterium]